MSRRPSISDAWRSAGPSSRTWRAKKLLASLIVLGSMSYLGVGGAFALLNGETSNGGATIATGTLTFGNKIGSGTICTSYGAGSTANVNSACDAIFTSATTIYPGDSGLVHVTIDNNGTLGATTLKLFMPSCTATNTAGAPSPGAGDPCAAGGDQFYVQETDSSFTPTTCKFPSAAGTCSFVADSLSIFASTYPSVGSSLNLGSGPASLGSRYFIIGMKLPSTAANSLQGRAATFDLTWQVST